MHSIIFKNTYVKHHLHSMIGYWLNVLETETQNRQNQMNENENIWRQEHWR